MRSPSALVIAAVAACLLLTLPVSAQSDTVKTSQTSGAIVFTSDRDSTAAATFDDIYLLRPGSERVDRLTADLDVDDWPTLSPDGRSLAWLKIPLDDNGVARIAETTLNVCGLRQRNGRWSCGAQRPVVRTGAIQILSWTPDGNAILYSGPDGADVSDIYSIRADGAGAPINLTDDLANDQTNDNHPTVSPDGRFFVYSSNVVLYRRTIAGDDPELLTSVGVNNAPDYSPDGTKIASRATGTATLTST